MLAHSSPETFSEPSSVHASCYRTSAELDLLNEVRLAVYVNQYVDRLSELGEAAVEDGYAMRTASANKFISFLQAAPYDVRQAGLALAGDGDINAIWTGEDRRQRLSVQVFADGDVECVLLTPDRQPEMARVQPAEFWAKFSERLYAFLSA